MPRLKKLKEYLETVGLLWLICSGKEHESYIELIFTDADDESFNIIFFESGEIVFRLNFSNEIMLNSKHGSIIGGILQKWEVINLQAS